MCPTQRISVYYTQLFLHTPNFIDREVSEYPTSADCLCTAVPSKGSTLAIDLLFLHILFSQQCLNRDYLRINGSTDGCK